MTYVDGELPPEQEEEICMLLVDNPDAEATVDVMRKSWVLLRKAFDPVLKEPAPERLLNCIRATSMENKDATASPNHRARIFHFKAKPPLAWAAALTLIIGGLVIYIGSQYLHSGAVGPTQVTVMDIFLEEALENMVSGAAYIQNSTGASTTMREIMPRLSFRNHDKLFYREYEERTVKAGSVKTRYGIACREKGHWHNFDIAAHPGVGSQGESPQPGHLYPCCGERMKETTLMG